MPRGPSALVPEGLPGHVWRFVPAYQAHKPYVCPGCGHGIPPRTGHVVAWPQEESDERRHWHRHCWKIAAGRGR